MLYISSANFVQLSAKKSLLYKFSVSGGVKMHKKRRDKNACDF